MSAFPGHSTGSRPAFERSCRQNVPKRRGDMTRGILRQITDLERMSRPELQARWRELYGTEPPAYRRDVLCVSRSRHVAPFVAARRGTLRHWTVSQGSY